MRFALRTVSLASIVAFGLQGAAGCYAIDCDERTFGRTLGSTCTCTGGGSCVVHCSTDCNISCGGECTYEGDHGVQLRVDCVDNGYCSGREGDEGALELSCAPGLACSAIGGRDIRATCNGSRCTVSAEGASELRCEAGTVCTFGCKDPGCTVFCDASATCNVTCPAAAPAISCADGRILCGGSC